MLTNHITNRALTYKSANPSGGPFTYLPMLIGLCMWMLYPPAAKSSSPKSDRAAPSPIHAVARYAVLPDVLGNQLDQRAPAALNSLGIRYAKGKGVRRNAGMAMRLFLRSAMLGYTPAMANIGTLYEFGAIGRPNFYRAYVWVRAALSFGVPEDDHDAMVLKLGMIAARLGPDKMEGAERLAGTLAARIVDSCECSPGQETELASISSP